MPSSAVADCYITDCSEAFRGVFFFFPMWHVPNTCESVCMLCTCAADVCIGVCEREKKKEKRLSTVQSGDLNTGTMVMYRTGSSQ